MKEGGRLSGDLDQRRADNTFRHWTSVLKAVGLPGTTPPCSTLQRGYRSTIPILEFAHRLLPRDTYRPIALQTDGPAPRIVETIREHVAGTVIQQIDRLVSQYPRRDDRRYHNDARVDQHTVEARPSAPQRESSRS